MEKQNIIVLDNSYTEIDTFFNSSHVKKILLVCGDSIKKLKIGEYFDKLLNNKGIEIIRFSNFKPNPSYESVVEGVKVFNNEKCQMIVAVGGGSSIDIAKCIKLYSNMNTDENYLKQPIVPNDIKLIAIPTTAGTGSEATQFAVIYYNGEKQSISDYSCIPSTVVIDASTLKTLPDYHRKVTMLDALCHAIESYWSINSTNESQKYSKQAIQMILDNKAAYLDNSKVGNTNMLKAANLAGKAINITQTTAAHAMCYKLTSLYGIAHGHAVALCISKLFPYMIANIDKCIDPRGKDYLKQIFNKIAYAMGKNSAEEAVNLFDEILASLALEIPTANNNDFEKLKDSVNLTRLRNNPISLDIKTIDMLYHQILQIK